MVRPITDEQIEIVKAVFAETGNLRMSARSAGVSVATAKKYADSNDAFEHIRTENRLSVIEYIKVAQIKFIEALMDPVKLRKATLTEIGNVFGTVTEKGLLLSGQATAITGTVGDPATRLTPDELVLAASLRAKLVNDGGGDS